MNCTFKHGLLGFALLATAAVLSPGAASAQFPMPDLTESAPKIDAPVKEKVATPKNDVVQLEKPVLVDSPSESNDSAAAEPAVAERLQARALYRSQQRIERLERNLWIGHEPLRPNWNSIPMMSSRYRDSRTLMVRYYVYP